LQRFSRNSAEQFGQKRNVAPQSELKAALLRLELPEAIGSDAVRFMLAETYHRETAPAIAIPDSSGHFRVFADFDLLAAGQTAAPGIPDDAPNAQATPGTQELSRIADTSVARVQRNRVTANLDRHVARVIHARGFKAQILVAQIAVLPQRAFNPFRPLRRLTMRKHQHAVGRE
jgi:hypothetical protein